MRLRLHTISLRLGALGRRFHRLRSFLRAGWRNCPLILLLVAGALCFGLAGLALQPRLPERRRADGLETPFLTGVFLYLSGERAAPEVVDTLGAYTRPTGPALEKPSFQPTPVPVVRTVDDSYFDDALFIGDSRIDDMRLFSGLDNATYFSKVGLSVYQLFSKPFVQLDGVEGTLTLEEALGRRQFGKIYLMVGINEMGTGNEEQFIAAYQDAIQRIRQLQPDAIFYVMGILSVTRDLADTDEYITLDAIRTRNADLAALADGKTVFYIDVNEVFADEDGYLMEEYADGDSHLKGKYYRMWADYIRSHAVVFE